MRKFLLAMSLSAVVAVPAYSSAIDDMVIEAPKAVVSAPIELDQPQQPNQPSLYNRVVDGTYNVLDRVGAADLACGTGNCLKAGARTLKDVGHVGLAATNTIGALGNAALTPLSLAYDGKDAANQNLITAKDYLYSAGSNLKTVASDLPKTYDNLKTGFGQLGSGAKKFGVSVQDAVTSDTVKNTATKAWNGVKSGANSAWNALKKGASAVAGWFASKLTPDFMNIDFS